MQPKTKSIFAGVKGPDEYRTETDRDGYFKALKARKEIVKECEKSLGKSPTPQSSAPSA